VSFGWGAEPVGDAFGFPAGVELLSFELGLAAAGGEDSVLPAGLVSRASLCVEPRVDLLRSLGEPVARCLRYAVDFGDVTPGAPLHAESFGQFEPQRSLEDLACGLGVVAHRVQHRYRLWGLEREVEAGYPAGVRMDGFAVRGQPAPAGREACEQRSEVVAGNGSFEPEVLGATPCPPAW
jgi:hypothetical protein